MIELIILAIINGLILGGVYALVAVGLNIIYGVMKIVNFAHGEFLMIGMYTAYWLFVLFGINPYLSVVLTVPVVILVAVATEKLLIEPVIEAPELNQLLITAGLSIFLQNLALLLWKADYRGIPIEIHNITVGIMTISLERVIPLIVAVPISILLYLFLHKTRIGRNIRAVAQDREAAELMGIDVRRVYVLTFALAGTIVGVASALLVPVYYVFPLAGISFGVMSWIIIVFGGLGSFEGALVGSFILGMVEAVAGVLTSVELGRAIAFVIFLITLIARPEGLLGRRKL